MHTSATPWPDHVQMVPGESHRLVQPEPASPALQPNGRGLLPSIRSRCSDVLLGPVGELLKVLQPHAYRELQLLATGAALEVESLLGADAHQAVVRQHGVGLGEELRAVPVVQYQGQGWAQVDLEPAVEVQPSLQDLFVLAVVEEVDAEFLPPNGEIAIVVQDRTKPIVLQDSLQDRGCGQNRRALATSDR